MQQQGQIRNSINGSSRFADAIWSPLVKSVGLPNKSYALFFSFLLLLAGAFLSTRHVLDPSVLTEKEAVTTQPTSRYYPRGNNVITKKPPVYQLNCSAVSDVGTCRRNNYPTSFGTGDVDLDRSSAATCPEYFRWIHEDLRPWARTGITRDDVERAKMTANFRLVIVGGRLYVEKIQEAFQTRDVFTIWGILQLLRRYPGKIPDLELMFDCVDWPVVKAADFSGVNSPPPLFRYCGNDETLDIVFPDWSFWGWPEVNIKPWRTLLKELKEGNKRKTWMEREQYAYWKGNPVVADTRLDLMKCNVSAEHDWNARLYAQDWSKESKEGYKDSELASQCVHRYKVYIEGSAWSVSEKYILACDSVTLLVTPHYYDFFTRGLVPATHYWPIKESDKCRSIKFAVDWGNKHTTKAQAIGKAASDFIQEELTMDYVYDYMYHLLTEYSKLLQFKPEIPQNASEICSETMACPREGNERKFMTESFVKSPAMTAPCAMLQPYDSPALFSVLKKKERAINEIEQREKLFWIKQNQTV